MSGIYHQFKDNHYKTSNVLE